MVLSGSLGVDFNPEDTLLMGADVVALFPNLDVEEVANEVMKELVETTMVIEEVD